MQEFRTASGVAQSSGCHSRAPRSFGLQFGPGTHAGLLNSLNSSASDLSVRFMGDKSPKSKSKQQSQKQAKVDVQSQKKKEAASAKQVTKAKK